MKCPIETRESSEMLLAWCARKLDASRTAVLEEHIKICPACRQFADTQRAVWEALDAWEAAPVSIDFDRRLYRRIENEVGWLDRLLRPLRPWVARHALPIAAAVAVVFTAGALLDRSASPPPVSTESAQVESLQPEQVEKALDDMQVVQEFNNLVDTHDARPDSGAPIM